MIDPTRLAADLESELQPLEAAASLAWWTSSTAATDENEARRNAADIALSDFLADTAAFHAIVEARGSQDIDPLISRRLDLLRDRFLPNQVPSETRRRIVTLQSSVESTFSRHRGVVGGRTVDDNAIRSVLRTSDDTDERLEAWEASKTVGAAVAGRVRELAHLRNEAARSLGFRDHFSMSLATGELDESRLLGTLEEVDRATADPFAKWKHDLDTLLAERFGCPTAALRPHHYEDPFFQEAPAACGVDLDEHLAGSDLEELSRRTFSGLGLDVEAILARSDLYPREGKSQHAFCIDIDREGDVRVLCNNVSSEMWAETMLHELGHGVYFDLVDRSLPWLLREMHSLSTEGIAMMLGGLVHDPAWLEKVVALSAADVDELRPRLSAARRSALLVFCRWVLVMTHFERGLYRDPDADHDTAWWDLVERFQLVNRPDRAAPDWAAKIHLAVAPVYYQNYLYGRMVAAQWRETLGREVGGIVDRVDAGRILTERYFRPGASLRWDHLIEAATGRPLSVAPMASELAEGL